MSRKISRAVDEASKAIDDLCEPRRMSKSEAVDFLEQVIDRCRSSIDALRDEMKEEDA